MKFFEKKKNRPMTALAPMDGITDCTFRQIVKKYSNTDLIFTEFVNSQGLVKVCSRIISALRYTEFQRPIIAQLFGSESKYFYEAAIIICKLGFDGIDINMGCPARNVASSGGGAALIRKPKLASKIVRVTKEAIEDYKKGQAEISSEISKVITKRIKKWEINVKQNRQISLSVKTRLGFEEYEPGWIQKIAKEDIDFISVHARSFKQKYKGSANWDALKEIKSLIDKPLIGNGDVKSVKDITKMVKLTDCDGVMIGRAAIGRPWVFSRNNYDGDFRIIKRIALEHAKLFKIYNPDKKFYNLRKHFAQYFSGFNKAKKIRKEAVQVSSLKELKKLVKRFSNEELADIL